MPTKNRRSSSKSNTVRVGNISNVSGKVNVAGGNITTHESASGLSAAEIEALFSAIYREIDARPATGAATKDEIKVDVKEIQTAVTEAAEQNETVDESFLARRFRNIARMAPDILELVTTMLANPLAGLGVAVTKIAQKAREATA